MNFSDVHAIKSSWVLKEISWALNHEKETGRTFVLPVILEVKELSAQLPVELAKRKYLFCPDLSESSVNLPARTSRKRYQQSCILLTAFQQLNVFMAQKLFYLIKFSLVIKKQRENTRYFKKFMPVSPGLKVM